MTPEQLAIQRILNRSLSMQCELIERAPRKRLPWHYRLAWIAHRVIIKWRE